MNTKTRKTGARLGALLLTLCLMMGLLPMTAFAKAVVRDTYNIYSDEAVAGGADSQVYAVTIEDVDGEDLHYVYSPNVPHVIGLMDQIRAGLAEPYKSLIPTLEFNPYNTGFLCFSREQEKYEVMKLDWSDPEAVANALISGNGSVSVAANDDAVNVTDISVTHAGKDVLSKTQFQAIVAGGADNYTGPSEFSQLKSGKNRVESQWTTTACTETVEGIEYFDVFDTMHVTQIYAYTAAKETDGTDPVKRNDYNVYSDEVIAGGSDSQVYAVTIKDESGEDLHYVYSPDVNSNASIEKIREGLKEPYKSLIPNFDEGTFNNGFLRFSRDQDKYENMKLNWADVRTVAATLIYKEGGVSAVSNDSAVSVTDISVTHADEKVVSEKQLAAEDFYTNPPELGQLASGKNRVESQIGITYRTEKVEDKAYYDVFQHMHVTQISAFTATKAAPASDPITLPVRVLEEGDMDYSPAPELSAAFTPDTAVTVGEFNEWQGLAIDYYYPMIDAELSEGYDIQAGYTVSIPLENYQGETLSGTLTIPLPQGYDGATARIKGGAKASSYTATTVSFPLTLDVSGNTAEAFELLIEYREAQEPVQPPVIIAGANGSWQKSGTDGLSFTSNAAFADFIKVQVDGNDLDASNYTVKEGSTIVTLNAAYLNTLSVGKHTLSIVSANGTATTEFTITAAPTGGDDQTGGSDQTGSDTTPQEPDKNGGDKTNPQTGDSSNILLWVALLFLSGGALSAVTYKKKKQTN